ncbi:MAG: FAD:protein FMN transferase [Candidatus Aegiribacteria sp.]|nr:FAD:protein FMN transferase [Candidatus Aegiribacteria sp.]
MPRSRKLSSYVLMVVLLLTILIAVLVRAFTAHKQPELVELRRRTPVLGTYATYAVISQEESAANILDAMDSLARHLDFELGVFSQGEVSLFNSRGYACTSEMSIDLRHLLEVSFLIASVTDSLFDPSIGALVNVWGFPHDPHIPDSASIENALSISGLENLAISTDTIRLNPGTLLDFGAIAKGYTADRVFDYAVELGAYAVLVEIGGEIRCGGDPETGRIWRLAVRNPRLDEIQEMIMLENGAVATSGDYESCIFENGSRFCHILDPRTGYPQTGVASVTVVADRSVIADALATAIAVGGTDTASSVPDSLFNLIIVIMEDEAGNLTEWRRGEV